ncbi:18S rRNA (guanine-N(7))-methyltransferase [Scenedesmus sp. PABB004]|nr:18S rRNA (guanine-N(7))-methyltransferase [Scenedesmus sp. PABB004]
MGGGEQRLLARPEDAADADAYYDAAEAERYTQSGEVAAKQRELAARALQLLRLGGDARPAPALTCDLGCGSGLSGALLTQLGLPWVGLDVSEAMLALAQAGGGGVARADLGQGLPLRAACLDAAISISALQWLLPAPGGGGGAAAAARFFASLARCLRPGGAAAAQFYPRDAAEAQVLLGAAARAGLRGALLRRRRRRRRPAGPARAVPAGVAHRRDVLPLVAAAAALGAAGEQQQPGQTQAPQAPRRGAAVGCGDDDAAALGAAPCAQQPLAAAVCGVDAWVAGLHTKHAKKLLRLVWRAAVDGRVLCPQQPGDGGDGWLKLLLRVELREGRPLNCAGDALLLAVVARRADLPPAAAGAAAAPAAPHAAARALADALAGALLLAAPGAAAPPAVEAVGHERGGQQPAKRARRARKQPMQAALVPLGNGGGGGGGGGLRLEAGESFPPHHVLRVEPAPRDGAGAGGLPERLAAALAAGLAAARDGGAGGCLGVQGGVAVAGAGGGVALLLARYAPPPALLLVSAGPRAASRGLMRPRRGAPRAAAGGGAGGGAGGPPAPQDTYLGFVFQPLQEVAGELAVLDGILGGAAPVEYSLSYLYHSLAAFFDRDAVGLPGFAAYFAAQSAEERRHAELLMAHQTRRGGAVKLQARARARARAGRAAATRSAQAARGGDAQRARAARGQLARHRARPCVAQSLMHPESEFASEARGEALWGLELALALERLNFGKLRALHDVASAAGDSEATQFIEHHLLDDQARPTGARPARVAGAAAAARCTLRAGSRRRPRPHALHRAQARDVKAAADLVSRTRRAGPGLGVFTVDLELQRRYGYGLLREAVDGGDGA